MTNTHGSFQGGLRDTFANIINVKEEIWPDLPNDAIVNLERGGKRTIHNLHSYPSKFVPQLPRWAIKKYSSKGDTVLDPFVGSGTTMVEAQLAGRNSFGMDINPLAVLISKVKTTPIESHIRHARTVEIMNAITRDKSADYPSPHFRNRDFWFKKQTSKTLAMILHHISQVPEDDMRDFLLVCFSSIIGRVSNVASGQILQARRGKIKSKPSMSRKKIIALFKQVVKSSLSLLDEYVKNIPEHVSAKAITEDARNLDPKKWAGQVDLIITSPSYINAIDYIWADKLRLHWLGLAKNDSERLKLMRQQIGTENISSVEYRYLPEKIGIKALDQNIAKIYNATEYRASDNQNQLRAHVVYRYFRDIETHFQKAYEVLPKGAYYCFVMGDNSICKVKIPTYRFFYEIAERIGFREIFKFSLILKNRLLNLPRNVEWADIIPYDRMIVLKKD